MLKLVTSHLPAGWSRRPTSPLNPRRPAARAFAPAACMVLVLALTATALATAPTPPAVAEAAVADSPAGDLVESVEATVVPQGAASSTIYAGDDDDGAPQFVDPGVYRANNIWILIAAALVFTMHLGFASVESGLCRAKNAVNIITKNVFIVCAGILAYWGWGFVSMYPGDAWLVPGVFALGSPLDWRTEGNLSAGYYGGSYTVFTDFIFQAMFAATAATIVSGAVAERIKLAPFMVFTIVFVMFGYPFTGSWKWGGGWLDENGFADFAGSSLVHAFGGWGALAGVLLLGPRIGKYGPARGQINAIPGHSIPLATIGVFLLFLGWFGFNGGSVLSAQETSLTGLGTPDEAFTVGVDYVFVTTTLAGVAGGLTALFTSWIVSSKPDLSMSLNGILAGLVGITAGADAISPGFSIIVGGIAGILVVFSVLMFDRIHIDDPVGAISVHGVCGVWGTLAVGIFGGANFVWQLIGTVAVSVTAFLIALVTFGILKVVGGIRVSEAEEIEGLDIGEHGMVAYHDLVQPSGFAPGRTPVTATNAAAATAR